MGTIKMNKKIATTLLTLFCFTSINSDSFAQDLLLQEHDFPSVNIHALTQLTNKINESDLIIPTEEGGKAGSQGPCIDEFHCTIYRRLKNNDCALDIGIGLGLTNALMLLTPLKQIDAVEISKPACLGALKLIKKFSHL